VKRREPADRRRPELPAELIAGPGTARWADPALAACLRAGDAARPGGGRLSREADVSAWRNYQAARRHWAAEHDLTDREFLDLVNLARAHRMANANVVRIPDSPSE
jgi:hypothetical protein